jgi:hypothetical protein
MDQGRAAPDCGRRWRAVLAGSQRAGRFFVHAIPTATSRALASDRPSAPSPRPLDCPATTTQPLERSASLRDRQARPLTRTAPNLRSAAIGATGQVWCQCTDRKRIDPDFAEVLTLELGTLWTGTPGRPPTAWIVFVPVVDIPIEIEPGDPG